MVKVKEHKGGRPRGIPCSWKGKKLPWIPKKPKNPKKKVFTAKMKQWADVYMKTKSQSEASMIAYDLDRNLPEHKKYAAVLGSTNKRHPLIIEYMEDVATIATDTIVTLARYAENERVKLSASQDILDRLGYKAPERLEIDDRRELSDIDTEAIKKVQAVLSGLPEPKEAEVIQNEQPETLTSTEPAL